MLYNENMKKPIQPIRQAQGKRVQGKRIYSGIRTKQKTDWEYFDDCYVCQAMKKSDEGGKDLSVEELKEVFKKANEQN